jgi:hypothetical protein
MKLAHRLAAIVVAGGLAAGMSVAAAPGAAAASWTRTGPTQHKAYSWNGYKATVKPAGFTAPRGSALVSAPTLTVKRSGTTVVRGKKWARLPAGTYTVYSTYKYRTKTPYTAYRSGSADWSTIDSCTIDSVYSRDTSSLTQDEYGYWSGTLRETYIGVCDIWDEDYNTITVAGTWTEDHELWSSTEPSSGYGAGDYASPDYIQYRQAYTAYRYGKIKTAYRVRTATVTKVVNTAAMTRTEYRSFGDGDSLATVRRIAGSKGELRYMDGEYTLYRWKNTSGGYTLVWFRYGYWDDDAWYSA